jgi:hypothetical protein
MAFYGALVQAGSGEFTYHEIADRLADVVSLILTGVDRSHSQDSEEGGGA